MHGSSPRCSLREGKYGIGWLTQTFFHFSSLSNLSCSASHSGQTEVLCVKAMRPPGLATFNHNSRTDGAEIKADDDDANDALSTTYKTNFSQSGTESIKNSCHDPLRSSFLFSGMGSLRYFCNLWLSLVNKPSINTNTVA